MTAYCAAAWPGDRPDADKAYLFDRPPSPTVHESPSIGVIVFYLPGPGYGYLRLQGGLEEFYFRRRNLRVEGVRKGDLVTFILREGNQGYFADAIAPAGLA